MLRSKRKRTAGLSVPKPSAAAARAAVAEQLASAKHPRTSGNVTVTACSWNSSGRSSPLMMSTPLITCTGNVMQPEPNTVYQNQNLIGNAIASTCSNAFTISSITCNLSTAPKCLNQFQVLMMIFH